MSGDLVDAEAVWQFLDRLGQCYRHPGTLYLVGGTSLLLVAAKDSTFDIDVQFEVPDEYHGEFIGCLRQVSRELELPVEKASPEQFIPLPAGYQDRQRYIGRFGLLDVFHFDFYSVALSKLHRGNEKDFADVVNMLQIGLIELQHLDSCFEEILPRYETYQVAADPDAFRRKFTLLKQRVRD